MNKRRLQYLFFKLTPEQRLSLLIQCNMVDDIMAQQIPLKFFQGGLYNICHSNLAERILNQLENKVDFKLVPKSVDKFNDM